jgi:hypothetical protein
MGAALAKIGSKSVAAQSALQIMLGFLMLRLR